MVEADLKLVIEGPFEFGRTVTGTVLWRWNSTAFPDERWSDFPVIVMSWWLKELSALAAGESNRVELHFMDRPYAVEIEATDRLWWMNFTRRGIDTQSSLHRILVHPDLVIGTVVAGAKSLVDTCAANCWTSDDLREVQKYIATLAPADA